VARYSIYLVECRDGTLYTGITTNVERRVEEHAASRRGARYLRGKGPLRLVYQQEIGDRSLASRVEARIKKLPRTEKADPDRLPRHISSWLAELTPVNTE
jgi:putative endonuclease